MVFLEAIGQPLTRSTRAKYLAAAAVVATTLGFGPALVELISRWHNQDEYSHGFLIPIVSGALLWFRREGLRESIGRLSWCGPVLIFAAVAMHLMGQLSAAFVISWIGFIIAIFGIVLALGGYALVRASFIPIVFLLFAIPLPNSVNSALSLQLQIVSSELGAFFIRTMGIPVYL